MLIRKNQNKSRAKNKWQSTKWKHSGTEIAKISKKNLGYDSYVWFLESIMEKNVKKMIFLCFVVLWKIPKKIKCN